MSTYSIFVFEQNFGDFLFQIVVVIVTIFVLSQKTRNNDPYSTCYIYMHQLTIETRSWPYDFPLSKDHPHADQRGTVTGRLLVHDRYFTYCSNYYLFPFVCRKKLLNFLICRYINHGSMNASFAYVGLAPPGAAGSWQRDTKVTFDVMSAPARAILLFVSLNWSLILGLFKTTYGNCKFIMI